MKRPISNRDYYVVKKDGTMEKIKAVSTPRVKNRSVYIKKKYRVKV